MKVLAILGLIVVGSAISACGSETETKDKPSGPTQVEVAANENAIDKQEGSDRTHVLDLLAEGAALTAGIQADGNAGQDAAAAGDLAGACHYVGRMRSKVDRVSAVLDELDSIALVHQEAADDLESLRSSETSLRANLVTLEAYC